MSGGRCLLFIVTFPIFAEGFSFFDQKGKGVVEFMDDDTNLCSLIKNGRQVNTNSRILPNPLGRVVLPRV